MRPMTERASRALAWSLAAAIIILTVVPPSLRPVTGAPQSVEHFAIFALCGGAFGFGYRLAGMFEGAAAVAFAGVVELLQFIMPGRHARVSDFVIDAIAGCVGMLMGRTASMMLPVSASPCDREP